ncbi:MAG: type II secretion system protein [Kiritimatiellales bacterium]
MNSGFTMIELLVVLAIILIMTGVAVATLSGSGTTKQQLRREARDLTKLFKEARLAAMERKLKVDVYVEPEARTVCAVETGYARKLLADNAEFFSDRSSLTDLVPESNRFFRVTTFPEEIAVEAFALSDIEPETTGEEPLFESAPKETSVDGTETNGVGRAVFSFTHLGGASGGGISVTRNGLRIDIACDLLTGLPEIVRRKAAQ